MEDFGLWTGMEIEKKINKRFDTEIEFGNRLRNNLNQRDESFMGLALTWSKKDLSFSTSYRISNENDEDRYNVAHRLALQGQYEIEIDRFSIGYRARVQSQYKNINSSKDGHIPESYLRNRFKVDYNIKGLPLKPALSCEFFYRINKYAVKQFERRRYILGLGYKINKDNQVGVSYILHETFNKNNPSKQHIIGIDYKLEI
ncbi:DUF2490 domain-containing protein [Sunxiuqinia sp. A32]|uniref:DUF2490 domain-containing protein n=1 Tax=Sunxiuqinia sp. A32 TaxID=3461496 RepID=UPI004046697B